MGCLKALYIEMQINIYIVYHIFITIIYNNNNGNNNNDNNGIKGSELYSMIASRLLVLAQSISLLISVRPITWLRKRSSQLYLLYVYSFFKRKVIFA